MTKCKVCNVAMDKHCPSPTCTWWKCVCGVMFDASRVVWKKPNA